MDNVSGSENTISGHIPGAVVQAGTVHGGVHVHPTSRAAAPKQLLSVPAAFTNRDRELAELSHVLGASQRHGPAVVVITGPGGVGKTALATRWITDHADHFPDGHLYADLGAFGASGPTATEDVLRRFLRAFGVRAADIPPDLAGQAALYRSVTAGKAVAVLIDDADTAAQARPLLPASPQATVIVTSRWRLGGLALDGARVLVVDPLDDRASLELLSTTVGRERITVERESAQQLIQFCAGLPIALCVVAARIAIRPQRPISRLVAALSDERRRIAALAVADDAVVQTAFDVSYRELGTEAARAYRVLGQHPGPEFGPEVAAAAMDTSVAEAEEALDDLVTASLLTEAGPDRYRFHDLARLHARQQAEAQDSESGAERHAPLRRMIAWYLEAAVAADTVVLPLRPHIGPEYARTRTRAPSHTGIPAALEWLERELANLVAAVRTAARRQWWELTWQLCEALWGLFLHRRHYPDWIRTHRWGIAAARRCGDRRAEARLRVQLGYAYLDTENHAEASRCFTGALELATECGDAEAQATALEHLGLVARGTGRAQEALRYFQRALTIAETLEQPRAMALHLRRMGEVLCDLGRPEQARVPVREAAELAEELGDTVLHMRSLTRLGAVDTRLGRLVEAEGTLGRAVEVLGRSGADHYHAEALEALAELRSRTGETGAAEDLLRRALAIYERTDSPRARRIRSHLAEISSSGRGRPTPPHNDR